MKRREMGDLLSSKLKVAGSNPAGVANVSRKQSRAQQRSRSPVAARAPQQSATQRLARGRLTNSRSLPLLASTSAPLTYVAAHTARLATKVE
jgi:hypothetical protein